MKSTPSLFEVGDEVLLKILGVVDRFCTKLEIFKCSDSLKTPTLITSVKKIRTEEPLETVEFLTTGSTIMQQLLLIEKPY